MAQLTGVALIGAGRIARVHGDTIHKQIPNAEIRVIADPYITADGEAWAKTIGNPVIVKDYKEAIAMKDVDAVFVCSSTDTHAEVSIAGAEAGKAVFCEKPVDHDLGRINEVLKAVEKAKVLFQVGFNRRFDRNFSRIKEAVMDGAIGDPHIIKISSRDPEPPPISYIKSSGGLFMDMMIHDFDIARYISGSDVKSVSATGAVLVNKEIGAAGDIDTALVNLVMENGTIVNIDNSRKSVYGYDQRLEVFGSKGQIAMENERPNLTIISNEKGVRTEKPYHFFLERYGKAYADESISFFEAVSNGSAPPVNGNDGLQAVRIAMAANLSMVENRVVLMSEIK